MLTVLIEAGLARRRGLAVYDIPDALTSLHHGVISEVTCVLWKLAGLGDRLRHLLVVVELHGEHAAALRTGTKVSGVAEHFAQRHMRPNCLQIHG